MSGTAASHLEETVILVDKIQKNATNFNGHCTQPFSMSLPPVSQCLAKANSAGICQAMTNRWIAEHAAGGSIWNTLFMQRGGKTTSTVDIGQIQNLLREQGIARNTSDQLDWNERYLRNRGVIPFASASSKIYSRVGLGTSLPDATRAMATAIIQTRASDGCYLNISMFKDMQSLAGHAVGAFVGGGTYNRGQTDLLFFDSNVGEFWFENIADFSKWFYAYRRDMGKIYNFRGFILTAFAQKMAR